jgi:hypothetical protein
MCGVFVTLQRRKFTEDLVKIAPAPFEEIVVAAKGRDQAFDLVFVSMAWSLTMSIWSFNCSLFSDIRVVKFISKR